MNTRQREQCEGWEDVHWQDLKDSGGGVVEEGLRHSGEVQKLYIKTININVL